MIPVSPTPYQSKHSAPPQSWVMAARFSRPICPLIMRTRMSLPMTSPCSAAASAKRLR